MKVDEPLCVVDDPEDIVAVSLLATVECPSILSSRSGREIDLKTINDADAIGDPVFGLEMELYVVSNACIRSADKCPPPSEASHSTAKRQVTDSTT